MPPTPGAGRNKTGALINNHTMKKHAKIWETEPGLVAFYNIRPGNGAGLFLQPRSLQGTLIWSVIPIKTISDQTQGHVVELL